MNADNVGPSPTDDIKMDMRIGMLLRVGVISSALVVLIGGVLYLIRDGQTVPNYRVFHSVPNRLNTLAGVMTGALHGDPSAIIQFGLLMLIATPVARVIFSVFAFLSERDYLYVVVSAIVLAVLTYSLIWN